MGTSTNRPVEISVAVSDELRAQIRQHAAAEGRPVSNFIRRAITLYIEQSEAPAAGPRLHEDQAGASGHVFAER
jgi:predicted transcriptional regulator